MCYKSSFASHSKSIYLYDDSDPRFILRNSNKKRLFKCSCGHTFEKHISSITTKNGWCPYCANKKLCNKDECEECFEKSFASHDKAEYWSNQNKFKARQEFKGSDKRVLFNCVCGHKFIKRLASVKQGQWCPYCANQKLCDNDCDECFEKSFASHDRAEYWSDKNGLEPRQVFMKSNKKYWFKCKHGHEFNSILGNVTHHGKWCPFCKSKSETKLFNFLKTKFDIERQFKAEWCKNFNTSRYLPFDFVIHSLNIIIELDGEQHFKKIWNWADPNITQEIDKFKMRRANENGYTVIRLLQQDVWKDINEWKRKLIDNLKIRDKSECIFISSNNEYCNHII